jgi:DNA replication protein DnaC
MNKAKKAGELIGGVLTAIKEPATKENPNITILQKFRQRANFVSNNAERRKLLEETTRFAASLNFTQPYWLTLIGDSGIGKTHLARAVWKQFMTENRFETKFNKLENRIYGNTGMWCSWRRACAEFRDGSYGYIEDLSNEWFVIIDDLGAEQDTTGFIASATDRILAGRKGKWTMITSNLFLKEIADRIDTRIASRMLRDGGVVIESKASDYLLET